MEDEIIRVGPLGETNLPSDEVEILEDILDQGQVGLLQLDQATHEQIDRWRAEMERLLEPLQDVIEPEFYQKIYQLVKELETQVDHYFMVSQEYQKSNKTAHDLGRLQDAEESLQKSEGMLNKEISALIGELR